MKAWNYDAGAIHYHLKLMNELYLNEKIDRYLQVGDHDHKFVLVGPKGIGKTLFLNMKSLIYREKLDKKGFAFYPKYSLCENLIIPNELLSKNDLIKFSNYDIWKKMWLFTLSIIICETVDIELPDRINKIINDSTSCSSIITSLLQDRKSINNHFEEIPYLLRQIEQISSGVGIFIDNIDQALRQFLMEYHSSDEDFTINPAIKVWTNSQNGLLSSIYDINRHNSHLKIFATIRSEAFNAQNGEMKLNFKNYCTGLKYSKDEIKKIIEINIDLTNSNYYINKNAKTKCEQFFGFQKMPHPFARIKKNNRKKNETTFDFIYRHSLGRPREMVYIGNQIFNNLIMSDTYRNSKKTNQVELLRLEVNKTSNELAVQYFSEIVPNFREDYLIELIEIAQSNVIPTVFMDKSVERFVNYLYSLGLLGYIKKKNHNVNNKTFTQVFLPVAEYSYNTQILLPKSKYYLTHPSLDEHLKLLFDLNFYNRNNIIGNGYDFNDEKHLNRTYDVALSFAGENRDYVEQVAIFLKEKRISVFYDNHHKTSLWGKDLYQHLNTIYKELANSCVIFISKYYIQKLWTKHELKAAQNRDFSEDNEYILPVRFDNTKIPGFNNTIGYLNANKLTPSELADEISKKIKTLPNNAYMPELD